MRKRTRILLSVLSLMVVGIATLALMLTNTRACPETPVAASGERIMTSVMSRCYGSSEVLELAQIATPEPVQGEVLVRVRAAGLNPLDWHEMSGVPYVMRLGTGLGAPTDTHRGADFAGVVEAVGPGVTRFKPGDEVLGQHGRAFSHYLVIPESSSVVLKPDNVTSEQAAGVAIAAVTALQALRDKAEVQPGQRVLINGASGGVGTFAVQIAKAMGAEVTGVCSTRNVELVRSLGADHVIDYTQSDFTQGAERYDVIIDNVGNHPLRARLRVLEPQGTLVIVGGDKSDPWIGPLSDWIKASVLDPFSERRLQKIMADVDQEELQTLADMMREGKVNTAIDRTYPLTQIRDAMDYLATGRARGKVILTMTE